MDIGLPGGPRHIVNQTSPCKTAAGETDNYWKAIVSNSGEESACGWCKDRWGISGQITPRVLTDAMAARAEAKRACAAMMDMGKIDIAKIEAARRGWWERRQCSCGEC